MTKSELKELIKEVISETNVDKSALHKELLKIKERIKYIRSYTNYGDTLSGSHLRDIKEINALQDRAKEILKQLKSVNEDWKDKAKAIGLAGALVGLPVGISKYAPTLRHNGVEYNRAMYNGDKSKLKKMTIDGKEVYVFHMGTGKNNREFGWGYMPVEK